MSAAVVPSCAGMYRLFDSTNIDDHRRAKQICNSCPMNVQCAGLLVEAQRQKPMPGAAYGPQGTWAGMLLNPRAGHS